MIKYSPSNLLPYKVSASSWGISRKKKFFSSTIRPILYDLGAIAPAREIPGDESNVDSSNEQFMKALKYFFTNVNLVLPVVAAVVVIVSAIVFICVFRAKHSQMMTPGNIIFHLFFLSYICI